MTPQDIRVCVESDGEIGIDFDFNPRQTFTFSIGVDGLGYSCLVGEDTYYGRVHFDQPLPKQVIQHLIQALSATPAECADADGVVPSRREFGA